MLGYSSMPDDNAVDPLGHGTTVCLRELDAAKPLRHAMHVDRAGNKGCIAAWPDGAARPQT